MKLDGKQQQQLCEALLSAFPTRLGLKMMVQYELNQNLSAITDESNLEYTVFELIEWFKARGKLEQLVLAALRANPENNDLVNFATSQGIIEKHVEEPLPVLRENVLIASLGESPAVVSIMYDLLTKRKQLQIDKVIILHPKSEDVTRGYRLVKKAFKELDDAGQLQCELLDFDDANRRIYARDFLSKLYKLLTNCQAKGDKVYLSLAGGHKSMSALIAWITPFFSCVQKLYHVIDKEQEQFLSVDDMFLNMTDAERMQVMHPDAEQLAQLLLVDIPFPEGQKISPKLRARLLSTPHDELEKMQDEKAEGVIFLQKIAHGGHSLNVNMTKQAKVTFETLRRENIHLAKELRSFFDDVDSIDYLRTLVPTESFAAKPAKVCLHMVSVIDSVKCVFYTLPQDVYADTEAKVEKIVICALEDGRIVNDRTLKEIVASPGFSTAPKYSVEEIPPILHTAPADSVLIVPLGKSPMVATQLYTLLTKQEQHTIRAVILVFPRRATEITASAKIIEKALREEADIPCIYELVSGWDDIDSTEACKGYQRTLEDAIDDARKNYPGCEIDLALSGGRKGMTAMTIFAAQKKKIDFVYHTLITDDELEQRIERETKLTVLNKVGLREEEPNNRLFLRAYEGGEPYTKFVLFRVPVFAPDAQ